MGKDADLASEALEVEEGNEHQERRKVGCRHWNTTGIGQGL